MLPKFDPFLFASVGEEVAHVMRRVSGRVQRPDIVPIPGTKRRRYLEENVGAAEVSLNAREMATLDATLSPEKVAGPRYNEKQMSMVDR